MVGPTPLARAYAACETLARSHYENFPVASWLLPARMRPHVAAVYAFARAADDFADEGDVPPAVRRERLDAWRARLRQAASSGAVPGTTTDDLIFVALGHSIRTLGLPVALFEDLLSAFEQDTMTFRYATWDDVLDYCRRSANPVGRLVLRIAGYEDDALDQSSDALCSALQLANFWQDFGRDWRAGRLYVPREVQAAHGALEADLQAGTMTPAWTAALIDCVCVTDRLFGAGRAVCDGVSGRLKLELRLTWLGGRRILRRVSARASAALDERPVLKPTDVPVLLLKAARWRRAT